MKGSNKKSSGVEETKNQEESKDKEGSISSNQDQPESALQNLVETGEDGGPIKKVKGYATLKELGALATVNKRFQQAMNKEIKQRLPIIRSISIGRNHTMLLVKITLGENKLYACGYNKFGQLGLGDTKDRNEWTEVPVPQGFNVEKVSAGSYYSFLKGKGKDGKNMLYACGRNDSGQLGLVDNDDRREWTEVDVPQGFSVEQVIAGGGPSFLKGKVGGEDKLYACGNNTSGQLGLGDNENRTEFTEVDLPEDFKLEQVVAGGKHTFLKGKRKGVNGEDKLYACGSNHCGQLGLGDTKDRNEFAEVSVPKDFTIEKVMAGYRHTFLKGKGKDGKNMLYACGSNFHGQLGLGDDKDRSEYYRGQIGLADNENRHEWTKVVLPLGFSVEKVIAGEYHSFLKGKVGGEDKLYACGNNASGQLGLGDTR